MRLGRGGLGFTTWVLLTGTGLLLALVAPSLPAGLVLAAVFLVGTVFLTGLNVPIDFLAASLVRFGLLGGPMCSPTAMAAKDPRCE